MRTITVGDLESTVAKETPYPHGRMSWELADKWAESIPDSPQGKGFEWEWRETPTTIADLEPYGLGTVMMKDESQNPNHTVKDRPAWERVKLYRDSGRILYLRKRAGELNGNLSRFPVPRLSGITAGNMGASVAEAFKTYECPHPKLLVDITIPRDRLEALMKLRADIYLTDLSRRALTHEEINALTNNAGSIDVTSLPVMQPQINDYDWFSHEVFNKRPTHIVVPYGAGDLFNCMLTWQEITARNAAAGVKDRRLRISPAEVMAISILGAEPESPHSAADALTKPFAPFTLYKGNDIRAMQLFAFSGTQTGIYKVPESLLSEATELMGKYCRTGHSGSAGMALYMLMFKAGMISKLDRPLIVNTGRGLL